MLRDKAATLLKIRPEEMRMVMLVAALFLCIQAGQGIGENAAFALFLARLDVDLLPYMYMGLGGVAFLASLAYATSLSRFQGARVIVYLLAGAVVLFAAEWTLIVLFGISLYPFLWLTTYGMSVLLGTLRCATSQTSVPNFHKHGYPGECPGQFAHRCFRKHRRDGQSDHFICNITGNGIIPDPRDCRCIFQAKIRAERSIESDRGRTRWL